MSYNVKKLPLRDVVRKESKFYAQTGQVYALAGFLFFDTINMNKGTVKDW